MGCKKVESSGYSYCIRKVTGQSQITVEFVIFPDFFKMDREKQEEDM